MWKILPAILTPLLLRSRISQADLVLNKEIISYRTNMNIAFDFSCWLTLNINGSYFGIINYMLLKFVASLCYTYYVLYTIYYTYPVMLCIAYAFVSCSYIACIEPCRLVSHSQILVQSCQRPWPEKMGSWGSCVFDLRCRGQRSSDKRHRCSAISSPAEQSELPIWVHSAPKLHSMLVLVLQGSDQGIVYPVAQVLVNITNSFDKKEIEPEMLELAKFAQHHVPEEDEKVP